jgi:hypothetical protein
MTRAIATLAASLVGVTACRNGPPTDTSTGISPSLTLVTVSGDNQVGDTGRLLPEFLVFRVTDGAGAPVTGLRVRWEVVSGGGQVSGKRHHTDAAGIAAGNFTLGPEPGEHVARAVVRDSIAIAFTAIALPHPPGRGPPLRVPVCCSYTSGLPIARIPTTMSASAPATPRSGRP